MEAPIGRLTTAVFNYAPEQQEEMQRAFDQIAAYGKQIKNSCKQVAESSDELAKGSDSFGESLIKSLDASANAIEKGFDEFVTGIALDPEEVSKDVVKATKGIGTELKDTLKDGILKGEWNAPDIGGILKGLGDNLFDKLIDGGISALFGSLSGGLGSLFGVGSGGGGGSLIGNFLGGGGFGGVLDSISNFFFAKGGAFEHGEVIPFARGGVVGSPTLFPLGMMGEAGPEAIMPLRRLSSGELGVAAGGGGRSASVVIHNHIDARGADSDIEERIRAVLREEEPRIVQKAARAGAEEVASRSFEGGSYARAMGRR